MRLHFGQGRIRGDVGESSISKVYENRIGLLVDGRLKQFDMQLKHGGPGLQDVARWSLQAFGVDVIGQGFHVRKVRIGENVPALVALPLPAVVEAWPPSRDRKSTRLNSSH